MTFTAGERLGLLWRHRALALVLFAGTLAVVAAGVVLVVGYLDVPEPATAYGPRGFSGLLALECAVIGLLVTTSQPSNAVGWVLATLGALWGALFAAQGYALSASFHGGALPLAVWAAWITSWIFWPAVALTAGFLLLLFPDGHLPSRRWRLLGWLVVLLTVVASLSNWFVAGPFAESPLLSNPIGISVATPLLSAVTYAVLPLSLPLWGASIFSLVRRWRHAHGEARQQIKWLAVAGILLFPSALLVLFSKFGELAFSVSLATIYLAVGIAVLRYRLYDLDLLVNRTLVYGAVTAVLAVLFASVNVGLQRVVESLTGQRSELIVAALGVGAGLAFGPLRRRVRPLVDQILPGRAVLTLLFTDLVGSTQAIVALGDERWRTLLGRYLATVRQELSSFGGHEVNTAGDSFFATFGRPAAGLSCAQAIRAAVQHLGLEIRTGVHIGECEMRGEQPSGLAVHVAARVMAAAGDGEILISSALRNALADSDVALLDRGSHELKGVPGVWQLYAVEGTSPTEGP